MEALGKRPVLFGININGFPAIEVERSKAHRRATIGFGGEGLGRENAERARVLKGRGQILSARGKTAFICCLYQAVFLDEEFLDGRAHVTDREHGVRGVSLKLSDGVGDVVRLDEESRGV